MKTPYLIMVFGWVIFLGVYSGIIGSASYSQQTNFIWGGEAVNVTSHDLFTEFQLKDPLYRDDQTGQIMKLNGTINADPLNFRFNEGQVVDYQRIYNPVYIPYLYEDVQREWDEYKVDGESAYSTKSGFDPMIMILGLWGITGSLTGAKIFQERKGKK